MTVVDGDVVGLVVCDVVSVVVCDVVCEVVGVVILQPANTPVWNSSTMPFNAALASSQSSSS